MKKESKDTGTTLSMNSYREPWEELRQSLFQPDILGKAKGPKVKAARGSNGGVLEKLIYYFDARQGGVKGFVKETGELEVNG